MVMVLPKRSQVVQSLEQQPNQWQLAELLLQHLRGYRRTLIVHAATPTKMPEKPWNHRRYFSVCLYLASRRLRVEDMLHQSLETSIVDWRGVVHSIPWFRDFCNLIHSKPEYRSSTSRIPGIPCLYLQGCQYSIKVELYLLRSKSAVCMGFRWNSCIAQANVWWKCSKVTSSANQCVCLGFRSLELGLHGQTG